MCVMMNPLDVLTSLFALLLEVSKLKKQLATQANDFKISDWSLCLNP